MIDYEKISRSLNEFGRYVLGCIRTEYGESLNVAQIQNITQLYTDNEFIVVDEPKAEDIAIFGASQANKNIPDSPSAHGGRTKNDGKIHIYPYSKTFEGLDSDTIIRACINDIVIHEIFHYLIRPDISEKELQMTDNSEIHRDFQHFIAEGLVQTYAEKFAINHRLEVPKSNYGKNVESACELLIGIEGTEKEKNKTVFQSNYQQLLIKSTTGFKVFEYYKRNSLFKTNLTSVMLNNLKVFGIDKNEIGGIVNHFDKNDNLSGLQTILKNKLDESIPKENQEDYESSHMKI